MGRPRIPTKIHLLNGNPGKRRLPENEPEPECVEEKEAPPSYLQLTDEAQAIWNELLLKCPPGVVTKLDTAVFGRYCQLLVDRGELRAFLQQHGRVIELHDVKGNLRTTKSRPQWTQLTGVEAELRQLETQLGFSPSARARVAPVAVESGDDELERMIFGD